MRAEAGAHVQVAVRTPPAIFRRDTAGPYSDYPARGVVPTVARFENGDVVLADGTHTRPDLIVAATGYRTGLEPLVGHLGVLSARGEPTHHAGHTHVQAPHLHFIGSTTSLGGLLHRLPGEARRVAQEVARGTKSP